MKILTLIISLLSPFTFAIITPVVSTFDFTFTMTPLTTSNGNSYGNYTITTKKSSGAKTATVYLVNDMFPEGELIHTQSYGSTVRSINTNFVYDNSLTRTTNTIRFEINIFTKTHVYEHQIDLRKSSFKSINSNPFTFTSNKGYLKCTNGTWETIMEKYSFSGFDSLSVPSYYHYLDLSNYVISLSKELTELNISNIKLYLTNRNGLYNDMPNDGYYLVVPLKINKGLRKTYSLSLQNVYYVHPVTLMMSETPKDEYVSTSKIYFPRNEMRYQGEYEAAIEFNGFGLDGNSLYFYFELGALINLMGDCVNSEYCIVNSNGAPSFGGLI